MGTHRPTTLWIPENERDQALAFLNAPFDAEEPELDAPVGFWTWVATHRRPIFATWLLMILFVGT